MSLHQRKLIELTYCRRTGQQVAHELIKADQSILIIIINIRHLNITTYTISFVKLRPADYTISFANFAAETECSYFLTF